MDGAGAQIFEIQEKNHISDLGKIYGVYPELFKN